MKPNLFIVGAAKAGTTALHALLSEQPEVFMSAIKEPNFFSDDLRIENFCKTQRKKVIRQKLKIGSDGKVKPGHKLYLRNEESYLKLFQDYDSSYKFYGEASVSYLYSKNAARNIFNFNPESKIIIILRDPIERAFSHFLMDLRVGRSKSSNFINAVEMDLKSRTKYWENDHLYIELGMYYEQIRRYLEVFPNENILILDYAEFKDNNNLVLNKIQKFLNLSTLSISEGKKKKNASKVPRNKLLTYFLQSVFFKSISKSIFPSYLIKKMKNIALTDKKIPQLTIEEREFLIPLFKADINKLENLLRRDFTSWKNIDNRP